MLRAVLLCDPVAEFPGAVGDARKIPPRRLVVRRKHVERTGPRLDGLRMVPVVGQVSSGFAEFPGCACCRGVCVRTGTGEESHGAFLSVWMSAVIIGAVRARFPTESRGNVPPSPGR